MSHVDSDCFYSEADEDKSEAEEDPEQNLHYSINDNKQMTRSDNIHGFRRHIRQTIYGCAE